MAVPKVTILIPVGPNPAYKQWLPEALESAIGQTYPAHEILLIDDAADLHYLIEDEHLRLWDATMGGKYIYNIPPYLSEKGPVLSIWKAPWRLGFSAAFNCGVGLAEYDLIVYLASDDKLGSEAVEDCVGAWEAAGRKDAWYAMTYMVGTEVRSIPINAAMITKGLWRYLGGFPPSAFAGPDALLLSCLMVHAPDRIIKVREGKPNYWIREHSEQETHHQASYFLDEMNSIRGKETDRFKPNPSWVANL